MDPSSLSPIQAPIQGPEDLRGMTLVELEVLAQDIRQQIISVCLKNGGHLGASLGAVEIAISLHTVFQSPQEPIIWDVGHQAYAHKLICGRWKELQTLRQTDGISGFLQRNESPHDVFGAGHSSTALSAALGIAWAKAKNAEQKNSLWTVAVIGDGALTAGLAFEALNNFRIDGLGPLLVILNDNQMSISENVGSLSALLSGAQAEDFFSSFGLEYRGPVDGHDLGKLIETLHEIRNAPTHAPPQAKKPILLHVRTQKGKGYIPAEEHPAAYHGVSPVQPPAQSSAQHKIPLSSTTHKSYSQHFGETLCSLAEKDDRIVAITAAMPEGTGLIEFAKRFPDRFFDVGIAEAHAVTFAAGLATQGKKPIVAIYSTFLQRALDSIIHDVALQSLGVIFAIDRAGLVGPDGPTHHGSFDLAYLGMIPNLTLRAPSCLQDLTNALSSAIQSESPWAIRYPRGQGLPILDIPLQHNVRWHQKADHPHIIGVALGCAAARLASAAQEVDPQGNSISVLSTTHAKPIPKTILEYISDHPRANVLTLEDGSILGGFGEAILSSLQSKNPDFKIIGYPDHFISHGSVSELETKEGLSKVALVQKLKEMLKNPRPKARPKES